MRGDGDGDGGLLSIGEVAERTGVATSTLRYYDELGLVRPSGRVSGRRRYDPDAVGVVGVVLLLRDVGFSLEEIGEAMAGRERSPSAWRHLAHAKVAELDEQIDRLRLARDALAHALAECEADDIAQCATFRAVVAARVRGIRLPDADPH